MSWTTVAKATDDWTDQSLPSDSWDGQSTPSDSWNEVDLFDVTFGGAGVTFGGEEVSW